MASCILKKNRILTFSLQLLSARCYKPATTVARFNLNLSGNLDGNSLQLRFLKYIGISNAKDLNTEKAKIRYSDFFPISDPKVLKQNISEVEVSDVPTLLNYLYTYNTRAPPNNVLSCINLIERETCAKIDIMAPKEIFNILFAYMYVIPAYTTQLKFYDQAMRRISNQLDDLSKEHLVQYSFYLGLSKHNNPEYTNVMRNILLILSDKYLNSLTQEELCIVTNAAFKMSVKINTIDLLNHISENLIEGLTHKKIDVPSLITLLKSLRISRYFNNDLLEIISKYVNTEVKDLNATAISHILPYYADNYYMDEHCITLLVSQFLEKLTDGKSETHMFESNNIRGKDLSRFLWALSYLGWTMNPKTLENLENIILNKFNSGDYKNNIDELFNNALSFCILNYIPRRLLRIILESKFIKTKSNTSRSEERKHLLFSILKIENEEIFEELPELQAYWSSFENKHTEPLTTGRQNLQKVLNTALNVDVGLSDVVLDCQIKFLNTPGISATANNGRKIHIEVLDDAVCLKNTNSEPNGIMKLKLRLLQKISNNSVIVVSYFFDIIFVNTCILLNINNLNYYYFQIKQSDIENEDTEFIQQYLIKEISKVI